MLTIPSSSLRITNRPQLAAVSNTADGLGASFELAQHVEAVGTVNFAGASGDLGAGWTVGFVQAQWVETNWALYRGLTVADGSVFVQRARPPARPAQACLDTIGSDLPFYGTAAAPARVPVGGGTAVPFMATLPVAPTFPLSVSVLHSDLPSDNFAYEITNGTTGSSNYLSEAQLEFAFCAMLAVRPPSGSLRLLRGFYWNVAWQSRFVWHRSGQLIPTPVAAGSRCNVGSMFEGEARDHRFSSLWAQSAPPICNAVFQAASRNPNLREVAGWPSFDVRR